MRAHLTAQAQTAPNDEQASRVEKERRTKLRAKRASTSREAGQASTVCPLGTHIPLATRRPLTFSQTVEEGEKNDELQTLTMKRRRRNKELDRVDVNLALDNREREAGKQQVKVRGIE